MAVVAVQSTQIANIYASPPVRDNAYLSGGGDWTSTDFCATSTTDSAGSTYRYSQIPSNAMVIALNVMNDANTAGTSYKCGVLLPNGGGVVVTSSDQIFFSAVSMATARNVWTPLLFPSIQAVGGLVANCNKRIWELLGLAADPVAVYEVAITAVTPGTAGGNMAVQVNWTR